MEPFKILIAPYINPREGHIVRATLSDEAYRELVGLSEKTNCPISQLASKAIEYAMANVELVEMI